MNPVVLFAHWAGFSIWLGAQLTFMIFGPASRTMSLESWANTWMTLAKVQRVIIAPAAAVATVTGIMLSMALANVRAEMGTPWLLIMQASGVLAGLLALFIVTPLANRMAVLAARSLEKGEKDPRAERVRSQLALVGSLAGALILIALYFSAAKPA